YAISTTGANASTTGYYTTVKDAMAAIETADEKTVTIDIGTLVDNVTVKAGQTVSIKATGIDKDAVFTAEDDSIVTLNITADSTSFQGMIVIAGDANSSGIPSGYASLKTGADGTKTYSGFLVAVLNATTGDVINIGSATVGTTNDRESLAIPAGVKVVVTTMLTINGNLTIPETAELVGGTIVVNGESDSKPATVNVAGKLDLSAGALSGNTNVTSSGEVIVQGLGSNMNGAYYLNNDSKYVLTSAAKAVQKASTVNIIGTYTDLTDITLDKADIIIAENAKVTLGKVTLVEKKITANGDLTATITAQCGSDETTGAVSDAILEVVKSSAVIESKKTTSAAGVNTYTFKIDKIDGEMKVSQGTVTTSANITSIATGSKFTVASGATFAVVNNVTINGNNVEFVVDGTMTVNTAIVTLSEITAGTGKAPVINGTLDIQKNGTVNASSLVVLGDVNIVNTETETGTFTVDTTKVQVGAPMETLGAGASVTGPMSIASEKYLIVYAGADMSKALINVTAGVSGAKTTEFYVNDVLYATVYNNGYNGAFWTSPATYDVITEGMLNKIIGVDDFDANNHLVWKDAEGNLASGKKVGEVSAVYATMNVSNANIMISVGEGISLYVDGVRISVSGTTTPIAVGEHTVKAIVDPGYKGTTTITFNGATVSNGKIVVTADMVGAAKAPVLSVTGEITIDTGSTPASAEKDDSGMGITDYLLIVLVILAAILVVVVAIRMMRS
ncbi:MAG: hypothetical protein IJX35_06210, partial [Candidatus Methanomethylophilaceae archaeon]|nr:hypothetical protein [Candidatus Methanomethylophilaceae archaeon]